MIKIPTYDALIGAGQKGIKGAIKYDLQLSNAMLKD
jgi:hypothetical protein